MTTCYVVDKIIYGKCDMCHEEAYVIGLGPDPDTCTVVFCKECCDKNKKDREESK